MALTRSDRITLTQRIGDALKGQQTVDLALALDTFDAPQVAMAVGDSEGSKYRYVLHRLTGVEDDALLLGLHAHLYPDGAAEAEALPDGQLGPWRPGTFRLFISHTTANKQLAGEISARLADFGIDAFVAHDAIEPTKEWQDEIEAGLLTCDALVAVLTDDFAASKWCDQEVGFALGRRRPAFAVHQGADPHGFIGKFQAIPGATGENAARTIAWAINDALCRNEATERAMAPAIAFAYAQSRSFDSARDNFVRLRGIPGEAWTDDMVEMVEREGRDNTQLRYGNYDGRPIPNLVSEHLNELLERDPPVASAVEEDIPF